MFPKIYKDIPEEPSFRIFNLNVFSVSEFLISFGKMSHIFGAKKETDSVPYLTEFTLRLLKKLFPRKFSCNFVSRKLHLKEEGKRRVEL